MVQRIQQLEDALAGVQSSLSSESHPLLADELLSIKFNPEALPSKKSSSFEDGLAETLEIFGTLAIDSENGQSRYFGPSAGSEVCCLPECNLVKSQLIFGPSYVDSVLGKRCHISNTGCYYP